MTSNPIILHVVRNEVAGDSRVLRALSAVSDAFPEYETKCAGYSNTRLSEFEIGGAKISVLDVGAWSFLPKIIARFMKYLNWHYQCVARFGKQPVAVVHCHELVPLMISVHLKLKTGCKIIYDAHELETECRTNTFDKVMKPLYKIVEWLGIKCVSCMITVSNSIRDWYQKRNPKTDIRVVLNCPGVILRSDTTNIINESKPVSFIYCGALVPGRGIDIYLDVFKKNKDKELYFLGDGPLLGEIIDIARKHKNITYLGSVKPDAVVDALQIADVSLCLIEDTTLTSKFCMPNKLFESIVAGLPIIVSDLPDLRQFVNKHRVGFVINHSQDELERVVRGIDTKLINSYKTQVQSVSPQFTWSQEKEKLIKIYETVLNEVRGV